MKSSKNKTIIAILAIILIAGIVMVAIKGFNVGLQYEDSKRIELNIGKAFENKDIRNITDEVIGKNVIIQKVEVYEDSVSITSKDITEEQKNDIITKINEKYELELKAEDCKIVTVPRAHLKDLAKNYIKPFAISTIFVLIYMAIRYNKLNAIKVMIETLAIIVIAELEFLSIIALARVPVGNLIVSVILIIYVLAIVFSTNYFEKKLLEKKTKEE